MVLRVVDQYRPDRFAQASPCAIGDLSRCERHPRWQAGGKAPVSGRLENALSSSIVGKPRHRDLRLPYAELCCSASAATSGFSEADRNAAIATGNAARAAAPVGAYCWRNNSCALADHGINSQSRHTQSVFSSSQMPATSTALRTFSRNSNSRGASLKNRRPVRV